MSTTDTNPTPEQQPSGAFDGLLTVAFMIAAGLLILPLISLHRDGGATLAKRAAKGPSAVEGLWLAGLLLAFPAALLAAASVTEVPALAVLIPGLLTVLAIAKHFPGTVFEPYSIIQIIKDFCAAPLWAVLANVVVLAGSIILACAGGTTLFGLGWVALLPTAFILGIRRKAARKLHDHTRVEVERILAFTLGTSEEKIQAMHVSFTGVLAAGTLRIRTGRLPVELVNGLAGIEERMSANAPEWEAETVSPDGVALVPATEATRNRRISMAESGGLIAGTTDLWDSPAASDPTGTGGNQDWDF